MKLYIWILTCLINITPVFSQKENLAWLQYNNNDFHFSINYPKYCYNVNARVTESDSLKELYRQHGTLSFWAEKELFTVSFGNQSVPIISVIIFDNSEKIDLRSFSKNVINISPGFYPDNEITYENFPFGKYKGLIVKYRNKAGGYNGINKNLFVEKGNLIYALVIVNPPETDYDEFLNSLVKSFKFKN